MNTKKNTENTITILLGTSDKEKHPLKASRGKRHKRNKEIVFTHFMLEKNKNKKMPKISLKDQKKNLST